MIAASFVDLLYWACLTFAVLYLLLLIERERQHHREQKRQQERKQNRIRLNNAEPQRWDDRAAHPWEGAS